MDLTAIEAFEALYRPKRLKSFWGGRGAAKSQEIAQYLVFSAHFYGDPVLAAREYQNSIEDSSYALIVHKIHEMGLSDAFDIQQSAIYHRRNGASFKFIGLARNIESIKSKFGFKKLWLEEAETVSERSWQVLIPTIREEGSEIIASWNPKEAVSATYKRLAEPYLDAVNDKGFYEDDYIYTRKVSYRDNPYFPDVLRQEMERDRETNYKRFLHIWEGQVDSEYEDSIIEPEWIDSAIDAHVKLNYRPRGEIVTSFDPADSGKDAKGLAQRQGMFVKDVRQWKDGDLDDAITRAFDSAFESRADILVYDSIGVGAGVKVGLANRVAGRNLVVHGFGGGDAPTAGIYKDDRLNKDVFKNKRAQYWWLLRDRFERTYQATVKGEYFDPETMISLSSEIKELAQLKAELVRQQRKRTSGSRLIQLVSKDEMRAAGIPSPNMADALVMAFAVDDIPKPQDLNIHIPAVSHYWR